MIWLMLIRGMKGINMEVDNLEDIEGIIKHRLNIGCRNAAIIVGNEIQEMYRSTIAQFYSDYHPVRYDRTGSLYKASFGVGGRETYYKQIAQMYYRAGITVGSENIPGEPYEKNPPHGWYMSKWLVFDRAYESGIHGFNRSDLQLFNKYKNKGERVYFKTIPKTSPKPSVEMKKKFKKVTKRSYSEQTILRNEINKAFGEVVV